MEKSTLYRIVGEGLPFALEDPQGPLSLYGTSAMVLAVTRPEEIDFQPGKHVHASYEFVIPIANLPSIGVGPRSIGVRPHCILPISSGQPHGPNMACPGAQFLALMVDSQFVNEVACQIWGQGDVVFSEICSPLNGELEMLIYAFKDECRLERPGRSLILNCLAQHITVLLLRTLKHNLASETKIPIASTRPNIHRAAEHLRDHLTSSYSLRQAAEVAGLSPYHFSRTFKQETGKTPYEFLTDLRLEQAQELLISTKLPITQICYECGFNGLNHFAAAFKRHTAKTPSQFREDASR